MQTKAYIYEALIKKLKLKFIGIYEFINDPYLNILEKYSSLHNCLDTWVLNKLESFQFHETINLDRLGQYSEFKIINWCALFNTHQQYIYFFILL